jgi:carnitine O-acetyltransferase
MLRQALNANRNNNDAAVEPAVDREVVRRNVGRRLRLSEY